MKQVPQRTDRGKVLKKYAGTIAARCYQRAWIAQHNTQEGGWKRFHDCFLVEPNLMNSIRDETFQKRRLNAQIRGVVQCFTGRCACLARLTNFRLQTPGQHPIRGTITSDEIEAGAQWTIERRGFDMPATGDITDGGVTVGGNKGAASHSLPIDRTRGSKHRLSAER